MFCEPQTLGSTGSSSGTIAASRSSETETCIVTTDLWNENPLDNWEEKRAINNFWIDLLLQSETE